MSEPKGMLDTSVNGPEDPPGVFDGDAWQQVDWRMHEQRVGRLRRWSNTLISVRQVTQRNAGRATAGIDGRVALTARPGLRWRCRCTPSAVRGGPADYLVHHDQPGKSRD